MVMLEATFDDPGSEPVPLCDSDPQGEAVTLTHQRGKATSCHPPSRYSKVRSCPEVAVLAEI